MWQRHWKKFYLSLIQSVGLSLYPCLGLCLYFCVWNKLDHSLEGNLDARLWESCSSKLQWDSLDHQYRSEHDEKSHHSVHLISKACSPEQPGRAWQRQDRWEHTGQGFRTIWHSPKLKGPVLGRRYQTRLMGSCLKLPLQALLLKYSTKSILYLENNNT